LTADARHLRFYVDESALGLGKELEATRNDTVYAGHPLIPECPLGTSDPDWMSAVATRDLVVIVRDRRIRTKPVERAQFRATSLRMFWIAGKRDQSTRQWLTRLERHWQAMERTLAARGPGPWFVAVNEGGLREIVL